MLVHLLPTVTTALVPVGLKSVSERWKFTGPPISSSLIGELPMLTILLWLKVGAMWEMVVTSLLVDMV